MKAIFAVVYAYVRKRFSFFSTQLSPPLLRKKKAKSWESGAEYEKDKLPIAYRHHGSHIARILLAQSSQGQRARSRTLLAPLHRTVLSY